MKPIGQGWGDNVGRFHRMGGRGKFYGHFSTVFLRVQMVFELMVYFERMGFCFTITEKIPVLQAFRSVYNYSSIKFSFNTS